MARALTMDRYAPKVLDKGEVGPLNLVRWQQPMTIRKHRKLMYELALEQKERLVRNKRFLERYMKGSVTAVRQMYLLNGIIAFYGPQHQPYNLAFGLEGSHGNRTKTRP